MKIRCPVKDFAPFEVVQAGAVPTVATFQGADPIRASGSPSDGSAERSSVFDLFPGGTGSALAVDHQFADTEVGYGLVDGPGPGRPPFTLSIARAN